MSKTPRTSAAWNKHAKDGKAGFDIALDMHREMAQLEIELADMQEEMNRWRDGWHEQDLQLVRIKSLFTSYVQSEEEASKLRKKAKEVLGL